MTKDSLQDPLDSILGTRGTTEFTPNPEIQEGLYFVFSGPHARDWNVKEYLEIMVLYMAGRRNKNYGQFCH